ncbi:MAG TPA: 3-methyl-2-oxobutanoate dehydrogenase subunit VorB [Anaeromyxobacter sp.]|nr:3-methyl-2-oxobutanoate dehydrogenase subunit VorB [Anaeromyxobacter sp.]
MAEAEARAKPVLNPEYCKACGRCIEACARDALATGTEVNQASGLAPVLFDPALCNGCGLCIEACPEPFGLVTTDEATWLADAAERRAAGRDRAPAPVEVPAASVPLPAAGAPLVVKGAHAGAIGALLAGCRHFFGYPITPSTEGAELMAKLLPRHGGTFLQASSEVAAVNMIFGCGAAGRPAMTFTSSPGFSLMLEGISYMIGAQLPGVFVNVMRAGPGLGNVGPAQADLKLACRGLGHGDTHAIALAPATPQEMLDFTMLAFELAFRYRSPVVVLADGYLGQMTGRVVLPDRFVRPGVPAWAVPGDAAHRRNLVTSILLDPQDFEGHNRTLVEKYARMTAAEQRAAPYLCDDAEVLLVACNTPAQIAKGAVRVLREAGVRAGLFRPQTVWPFPVKKLLPLIADGGRARRIVVVEASDGQLEDELRLALSHAGAPPVRISHVRRLGGILPGQREIVEAARAAASKEAAA